MLGKPTGRKIILALATAALPAVLLAQRGRGGGGDNQIAGTVNDTLMFKYMGPATSGRIASIVGVPGDLTTWFLGSALGGVWKTTDGGATFRPVFDKEPVAAIGTMAVAPSNHSIVWVGTGEPWIIRYGDVAGDGVYKSTDLGETWQNMGLPNSGRIARIIIHPTNPDIVYVCAVGFTSGPEKARGVWKTTDGGRTWNQVLFVNDMTSCSGLSIDQSDPNTLVAGTWTIVTHTWGEFSGITPPTDHEFDGKQASGVWITHDGGAHWTQATAGLPHQPVGKVDVEIAPSNSKIVYALMQTADQGSLWRSDDGGANWAVVSWDRSLIGRAGYYIRLAVNPKNPEDVLISSSGFHQSTDGGKHFSGGGGGGGRGGGGGAGGVSGASCGDCHDIWMDPEIAGRYGLTDDGGSSMSNGPNGTVSTRLPNGQMYHIFTDNRSPYWIYSNRQDDGTMRGPSTVSETTGNGVLPEGSLMLAGAAGGNAFGGGARGGRGGGGAAAVAAPAGGRGGRGGRGAGAGAGRGGAAATDTGAAAAAAALGARGAAAGRGGGGGGGGGGGRGGRGGGTELAWQPNIGGCESGFTEPDPTNADIVWATCYGNKVTRWDARQGQAYSIEPDKISLDSPPNEAKYRCHWTAPLAIDPFDHERVYYGCQMVLMTNNKGSSWSELSPDLSTKDPTRVVSNGGLVGDNLGQWDGEVVWSIAPSPIKSGLLWVGTNDGKLWLTHDSHSAKPIWIDLTKNLTGVPAWGQFSQITPSAFDSATAYLVDDVHLMDNREPFIFKTTDFGKTWKKINGDIPTGNPLDYAMSIMENPNKKGMLFAGTGHAFYYSMDDGTHWVRFMDGLPPAPVSWITVQKTAHDVDISTYGRGLYILHNISFLEQTGQQKIASSDTRLFQPLPGLRSARSGETQIVFSLAPDAARDTVKLEIMQGNQLYKTLKVIGHEGLNTASWNLRLDAPVLVALRTTPPENPHIWDEYRFQNTDTRTITHWGINPGTSGVPYAAPGKYTVRMTVGGKTFTQPFEVVKNQEIDASDADLVASTKAQIRARDAITLTSTIVNRIEVMRKQLEDERKANAGSADIVKGIDDMDKKFLAVELRLVTRSEMLSDDKYFPEAYRVYMNLIWLSGGIGTGASDEAGRPDARPTDQQMQTLAAIEHELASVKVAFDGVLTTSLPAFNTWSTAHGLKPLTDPK